MSLMEYFYPILLPVALFIFALSLWRHYIDNLRDMHSDLPLPPGTVGFPIVGETLSMILQGWEFYKARREKYGRVYKTHILGKPTIRVWGTDNIKKILKNEETLVTMSWPTSVVALLGQGAIVNSTRRIHNTRRSIILKCFSQKAITEYSKTMEEIIRRHIQSWCTSSDVLFALQAVKKLSFEVAARVFLGTKFTDAQMQKLMRSLQTMQDNFFTLPVNLPGTGYYKAMKARKEVISTIQEIVKDKEHQNMLKLLMPRVYDGTITQSELEDGIIEMFFSAVQGLPSMCSSAVTQLGRNPSVINNLLQEQSNCGLLDSSPEEGLIPSTMSELHYLEQTWREIGRIAPPFGGGFRQVIKTFEIEGYQVPAGWTVLYSIRDNHEAEENYVEAKEFNPDRWMDKQPSDSFFLFGGNGIRSCVGRNYTIHFMKQFISILIQESEWSLANQTTPTSSFPVYLPTDGLPVIFTPRKRNCEFQS